MTETPVRSFRVYNIPARAVVTANCSFADEWGSSTDARCKKHREILLKSPEHMTGFTEDEGHAEELQRSIK